jgi:hypothetical protein
MATQANAESKDHRGESPRLGIKPETRKTTLGAKRKKI